MDMKYSSREGLPYALLGAVIAALSYIPVTGMVISGLAFLLYGAGVTDPLWVVNDPESFFLTNILMGLFACILGGLGGMVLGRRPAGSWLAFLKAVLGGIVVVLISSSLINAIILVSQRADEAASKRFEKMQEKRTAALESLPSLASSFQELTHVDDFVYDCVLSEDGKTLAYSSRALIVKCDM